MTLYIPDTQKKWHTLIGKDTKCRINYLNSALKPSEVANKLPPRAVRCEECFKEKENET